MPKREKTPPPPDDEPRYLTVVHPYPPHANVELLADQKEFAFWMASCTGKDPFLAFFYKPSSPNMIIVEIARDFPGFDRLLGEHRWSEVFQSLAPVNKERKSKVFYCKHSTGREVQKHGWKRIFVEERWFTEWNPINRLVNYPYPATHWCEVPPEDATNEPLCRPLPVKDFKPPPKPVVRLPPVGAEGWQEARKSAAIGNAWKKGPPAAQGSKTALAQRGTPVSSASASRPNAWGAKTSPPVLAAPAPEFSAPPGLKPPNPGTFSSTWSTASSAWTTTSAPSRTSSAAGSSTESDGGSIGQTPAGSEFPDRASIVGFGDEDDVASLMESMAFDGGASEWGTDAWNSGQYAYDQEQISAPDEEEVEENLWADYGATEEQPKEPLCRAHGIICRKGICREYAKQLRELERKKAEEEKEQAAAQRKANKKWRRGPDPTSAPPLKSEERIQFTKPRQKPTNLAQTAPASTGNEGSSTKSAPAAPQAARTKPAHLAGSGALGQTSTARPARGRKMNAEANKNAPAPQNAAPTNANDDSWSTPQGSSGKSSKPASAKDTGTRGGEKKSWADQMEDDDTQSVTSLSTSGGWGKPLKASWD